MQRTLFILAVLIFGISCGGTVDRKFIYKKPDITVTDAYVGRLVAEYDSVIYSNLSLRVDMPYDTYTASANIWPGNKVYASHKESGMQPMEKIKDIRLVTLNDYNTRFPKGSDMSDSCLFSGSTKLNIISYLNQETQAYGSPVSRLDIKLKTPPAARGLQQFALVFETKNGSTFSDTTLQFTIKP